MSLETQSIREGGGERKGKKGEGCPGILTIPNLSLWSELNNPIRWSNVNKAQMTKILVTVALKYMYMYSTARGDLNIPPGWNRGRPPRFDCGWARWNRGDPPRWGTAYAVGYRGLLSRVTLRKDCWNFQDVGVHKNYNIRIDIQNKIKNFGENNLGECTSGKCGLISRLSGDHI